MNSLIPDFNTDVNKNDFVKTFLSRRKFNNNFAFQTKNNGKDSYFATEPIAEDIKKINKFVIAEISAATTGGILLAFIGISLLKPGIAKKLLQKIQTKLDVLADKAVPTVVDKSMQFVLGKVKKVLAGTFNVLSNLSLAKDITVAEGLMKMDEKKGILTSFVKKTTSLFSSFARKTGKRKYKNLLKSFNDTEKRVKNYLNTLENQADKKDQAQKAKKLFNCIKISIQKLDEGFDSRCADVENHLQNIFKQFIDECKGHVERTQNGSIKDKVVNGSKTFAKILSKSSESYIAEDLANTLETTKRQQLLMKKNKLLRSSDDMQKGLVDMLQESLESLDAPDSLKAKVSILGKKINKTVDFETSNLFQRLRDLKFGAAPMEAISLAIPVVYMGNSLVNAEDKQERKEALLTKGVPLFGGVSAWIYSSIVQLFNAPKALMFSIITGGFFAKVSDFMGDRLDLAEQNRIKSREHFS